MGEDFKGDHLKLVKDVDKDMEDFIVMGGAQSISEIWEGCFTGDIFYTDTGPVAVTVAAILIP